MDMDKWIVKVDKPLFLQYIPSVATGLHQYPVKRSNSSWITNVATPADFGSSLTLFSPVVNKIAILKTKI